MEETLLFEEEKQIKKIRENSQKKDANDLNKKNLSSDDLDEIFCEF